MSHHTGTGSESVAKNYYLIRCLNGEVVGARA